MEGVLEEEELEHVRVLVKRYMEAISVIDPDDKGIIPEPVPKVVVLQEIYSKLLRLNKDYYVIIHKAFGEEIAGLATALKEL